MTPPVVLSPSCPACGGALRPLFEKDGRAYTRCAGCGTAVMGVAPGQSPLYHDYIPQATMTLPEPTRKRYRELLATFAPYRTSGRLLDVGCGTGFFVAEAAAGGWKAEGTEVSPSALEFCRSRGLHVHEGVLADLPVEPGSLDVITLFEVIEHVETPDEILRDSARLLRPGGVLYMTTPNFGSLTRRLLGKDWAVISVEHVVLYSGKGLLTAVRRAGFRPVRLASRNIIPHEIRMAFRPKEKRVIAVDPKRTAALQAKIESKPSLLMLKKAANAFLTMTGLGDTLYLTAVKGP